MRRRASLGVLGFGLAAAVAVLGIVLLGDPDTGPAGHSKEPAEAVRAETGPSLRGTATADSLVGATDAADSGTATPTAAQQPVRHLRGQVLDARGRAVAGGRILVLGIDLGRPRKAWGRCTTELDAAGHFELALPEACKPPWQLRYRHGERGLWARRLIVAPPTVPILVLAQPSSKVRVSLTDVRGRPMSTGQIYHLTDPEADWVGVENGHAEFEVDGRIAWFIARDGHGMGGQGGLRIDESGEQVLAIRCDRPVRDCRIQVRAPESVRLNGLSTSLGTILKWHPIDASGWTPLFMAFADEALRVSCGLATGARIEHEFDVPADVNGGEPVELAWDVSQSRGAHLTLLGADGSTPLPDVRLELDPGRESAKRFPSRMASSRKGLVTIAHLQPGRQRIRARVEGVECDVMPEEIEVPESGWLRATLRVANAQVIRGKVEGAPRVSMHSAANIILTSPARPGVRVGVRPSGEEWVATVPGAAETAWLAHVEFRKHVISETISVSPGGENALAVTHPIFELRLRLDDRIAFEHEVHVFVEDQPEPVVNTLVFADQVARLLVPLEPGRRYRVELHPEMPVLDPAPLAAPVTFVAPDEPGEPIELQFTSTKK